MSALDLAVLGAYLVGTVCLGLMLSRGQFHLKFTIRATPSMLLK